MNPLLWIVGRRSREAERQHYDPGPIHEPYHAHGCAEAFTRLLRAKGRRIAIGMTFVPPGWIPSPEIESKLTHGATGNPMTWYLRWNKWKEEFHVGKNR